MPKYDVTMRRIRVTIVAVEKQYVLHILCVCGLSYSACKTQAPYCHLSPVRSTTFFPHYPQTARFSGQKILNTKCILTSSTTFVRKIFHSKKNSVTCLINAHGSPCKVPFIYVKFFILRRI